MLTKIPDYIISDCGYPECNAESQQINLAKIHASLWRNSSIWSAKSTNLVKLLPLRETLTDYYMVRLSKQKESHPKISQNYNNNKTQQTQKEAKRDILISRQHCVLDKRRSQSTSFDNDLDQF